MSKKNKLIVIPPSTELEIAEIQLERLKDIARARLLTLEETKQYDLLVKNLINIREKEENIPEEEVFIETARLIEIAITPVIEEKAKEEFSKPEEVLNIIKGVSDGQ